MAASESVSGFRSSLAGIGIDVLEFARLERQLNGPLEIASLPRLQELLVAVEPGSALQCEISGWRERGGKSWLRIQVRGDVQLQCQRCLEPMQYRIELNCSLQLIAPGQAWPDETQEDGSIVLGADAVAADESLALPELIEEEVLLALPIVPRHKVCAAPARNDDKQATSPFAVLAQLKKH